MIDQKGDDVRFISCNDHCLGPIMKNTQCSVAVSLMQRVTNYSNVVLDFKTREMNFNEFNV